MLYKLERCSFGLLIPSIHDSGRSMISCLFAGIEYKWSLFQLLLASQLYDFIHTLWICSWNVDELGVSCIFFFFFFFLIRRHLWVNHFFPEFLLLNAGTWTHWLGILQKRNWVTNCGYVQGGLWEWVIILNLVILIHFVMSSFSLSNWSLSSHS